MKKRIFNTAVALVAAMSLSTAAFAEAAPGVSGPGVSGPGVSGSGWSGLDAGGSTYEETVYLTDLADDDEVMLGSVDGLGIEGTRDAFPKDVTSVTLVSAIGKLTDDAVKGAVKGINSVLDDDEELVKIDGKYAIYYGISVTLLDQNGNVIEPLKPLTVYVVYNDDNEDSTSAAYVSDDGKTAERVTGWNKVKSKATGKYLYFTFSAKHFSKYYMFRTAEVPKTTTTTNGSSGGNNGGGFGDPGSNSGSTTTTQAPAADTTTKAPEAATTTKPDSATTTTKAPADGTTKAPSGGNTPDDGSNNNNNNVGNDGNGNGPDKNQATGVVLAVIPAAIAASAVVISKKRK